MLSLRGRRNLLACLVGKTPRVFKAQLYAYDSYISRGESACLPDMICPVNKCMLFRELRIFSLVLFSTTAPVF